MDPARDPRADQRPALIPPGRTRAERLRRWLRPPRRLHPTRAGWIFFLLTFGVGFAALNTGNNLLYLVLSLMLAFLVLSGVLSEAALRGIRVRRQLPREMFAESDALVGLEIRNIQRRVTSFAIVVEDRIAGDEGDVAVGRGFALRLDPGSRELRSYRFRPGQRGVLEFRGFAVFTRFPFGLFSKALALEAPERALVYPGIERVALPPEFGEASRSGDVMRGAGRVGADASGLREWAPGDAPRRIHWRSSLRAGHLLVRELESEQEAEVEVRLRTAGEEPGDPFEQRVRWAASEAVALLDAGLRVALRTDVEHLEADRGPRHRTTLLAFLARVQPSRVDPDPA